MEFMQVLCLFADDANSQNWILQDNFHQGSFNQDEHACVDFGTVPAVTATHHSAPGNAKGSLYFSLLARSVPAYSTMLWCSRISNISQLLGAVKLGSYST